MILEHRVVYLQVCVTSTNVVNDVIVSHNVSSRSDIRHFRQNLPVPDGTGVGAEIERVDGDTLLVDFGEVEDGCTLDGREVGGQVMIDFRYSETDIVLEQNFALYRDARIGVSGQATVTIEADLRTVNSSVTLTRGDRERNIDGSWTERPIDLEVGWDSGVVIDGAFDIEGCMGTATRELIGLELLPNERVPQAGQIRHAMPFGERSIEFERIIGHPPALSPSIILSDRWHVG